MVPSIIGILTTAAGLYLIYLGIYGGPGDTLRVYPKTKFDETYVSGTGSAPAQ